MASLSICELIYTWLNFQDNAFQKSEIIIQIKDLRELTRKIESELPYLNVDFDRAAFADMAHSLMPKDYILPSSIEWPTAEIRMMAMTLKKLEWFKPSDGVWEDLTNLKLQNEANL